jgi:hypothetical protein
VEERDGRNELLAELDSTDLPLKLSYKFLVGTSFQPRSASRCNGIIQAAIKGQKRDFIGDWPADNFLRWAHALGFVKYDYLNDTFSVTESGAALVMARNWNFRDSEDLSVEEKNILTNALLAYPPAMRILSLLAEGSAHMTKFEIGGQLGFVGEGGFTSLPQDLLIMELAQTTDPKLRNDMKSDWEGSSDKYARTIAKWLCNLGLVRRESKEICIEMAGTKYSEKISQAYRITAHGLRAYRAALGVSRHKRIVKNVYYELFSPSGKDREYLRLRRSYIVKFLSQSLHTTIREIQEYLHSVSIDEQEATILDDVNGLINIGMDILLNGTDVIFNDKINDFEIPVKSSLVKTESTEIKDMLRSKITNLSHDYLSLVDLAYDGNQNRMFEMKTMDLFVNEYGFVGRHLGGTRKPDGIMYTRGLTSNYGVIVDTKAYSQGYNLPISHADEMSRYIRENQNRNDRENPNKWWESFDSEVTDFKFLFVAGEFKGRFEDQLERIALTTGTNGAVLSVITLLLCADMVLKGEIDLQTIGEKISQNREMKI